MKLLILWIALILLALWLERWATKEVTSPVTQEEWQNFKTNRHREMRKLDGAI